MTSRKVQLGEVADTCLGKMLDQNKNKGDYQPYLANVNVRWGGFDLENLPQMRFEKHEEERYGLRYGDILVCEGGEPGRCAIWKNQLPNMKFQKALHRIRVHEDVLDYRWLFYRFLYAKEKGEFDQYFSGTTTIKHMPGEKLVTIRFQLPDLKEQKRIAGILSAYDDLIENNRSQIKLLEEAARRLYREWFVDFRFPGHEQVKIVDGVPEGWMKCNLSEVVDVNCENISSDYSYPYIDYIDLSTVKEGRIDVETRYKFDEAPGRAKRIAHDGDIIWGMVRPNLKSYALVLHPKDTNVFSTGFAVLSARNIPFTYLYCCVTQNEFIEYLMNCTNGAAYPAVKPAHFENAKMLIPTDDILEDFHNFLIYIYRKVEIIENQIVLLKNTRDNLLPRLIKPDIGG